MATMPVALDRYLFLAYYSSIIIKTSLDLIDSFMYWSNINIVVRGGALVESKPFDWRVVGSNPALAAK